MIQYNFVAIVLRQKAFFHYIIRLSGQIKQLSEIAFIVLEIKILKAFIAAIILRLVTVNL